MHQRRARRGSLRCTKYQMNDKMLLAGRPAPAGYLRTVKVAPVYEPGAGDRMAARWSIDGDSPLYSTVMKGIPWSRVVCARVQAARRGKARRGKARRSRQAQRQRAVGRTSATTRQ